MASFKQFFDRASQMPSEEFCVWMRGELRETKQSVEEFAATVGEEPHFIERVLKGSEEPTKAILEYLGVGEVFKEEYEQKVEFVLVQKKYYVLKK